MHKLLERIITAPVYDLAVETPLEFAPKISHRLNNAVYFKREDKQPIFSFKIRGAYTKMIRLAPEQLQKGVIAASAGNHAQGVAMSAKKLGVRAVIVMPETTPNIKIDAVKAMGGEVVKFGQSFDEAAIHAKALMSEHGLTFVHPYDDIDVIAGQGTVAMEILRQFHGSLDAVFVAVGGGGLIAGMTAYIKRLYPHIRVIGVEPIGADCMTQAFAQGERIILPKVERFADGVAVRQVGELPYQICKGVVDEMITVSTDEICAAIKDTFEDNRSILEPAGAVALAGLKRYCKKHKLHQQNLVAIASGANTDFDRLRFVADRAETGEQREALFAVTIPEKPGSYLAFCRLLGNRGVTEFNYRMANGGAAHIFVGVGVENLADHLQLRESFSGAGLPYQDLTDNDIAKTHLRHMIGGPSRIAENETIYRFEFPESPGALIHFLEKLSGRWNISLFHYRNSGGVSAEILAGLQVPKGEMNTFREFLLEVGYPHTCEDDNPAYRLFLQGGHHEGSQSY